MKARWSNFVGYVDRFSGAMLDEDAVYVLRDSLLLCVVGMVIGGMVSLGVAPVLMLGFVFLGVSLFGAVRRGVESAFGPGCGEDGHLCVGHAVQDLSERLVALERERDERLRFPYQDAA